MDYCESTLEVRKYIRTRSKPEKLQLVYFELLEVTEGCGDVSKIP